MTLLLSRGRVLSDDFRLLQLPTAEHRARPVCLGAPLATCTLPVGMFTYLLTYLRLLDAELDDLGFDGLLGVRDDLLLRGVVGHGLELVLLKLDGLLVDADNLGRRPLPRLSFRFVSDVRNSYFKHFSSLHVHMYTHNANQVKSHTDTLVRSGLIPHAPSARGGAGPGGTPSRGRRRRMTAFLACCSMY
jgi:hypothetical protein